MVAMPTMHPPGGAQSLRRSAYLSRRAAGHTLCICRLVPLLYLFLSGAAQVPLGCRSGAALMCCGSEVGA